MPSHIFIINSLGQKTKGKLKDKYPREERLAVLLSGKEQVKLLGVSKIHIHSTEKQGTVISRAVSELLDDWYFETDIKFIYFDTTSANTGHLTAACIQLQVDLKSYALDRLSTLCW